jgi:hypothetical protein
MNIVKAIKHAAKLNQEAAKAGSHAAAVPAGGGE